MPFALLISNTWKTFSVISVFFISFIGSSSLTVSPLVFSFLGFLFFSGTLLSFRPSFPYPVLSFYGSVATLTLAMCLYICTIFLSPSALFHIVLSVPYPFSLPSHPPLASLELWLLLAPFLLAFIRALGMTEWGQGIQLQ